jgi:hypothetical protein
MKLFGRNQSMDNLNVEKPIVLYYAKYIGVLSSNKSYPVEEGAYVNVYEDRMDVDLPKSKFKTTVPYKNMTDIQNVDAGNKVDLDRVIGLGLLTGGIGSVVALFWKRHHIITIIKYTDENLDNQIIALDFESNTEYAQPIIDKKMREARNITSQDTTQGSASISEELSKLAKLIEQGVITEEEFSQMKSNLMRKM